MKRADEFEFILALCIGCLVGSFAGCNVQQNRVTQEAIEAGVAEYYLDADFQKQFRWRTNK